MRLVDRLHALYPASSRRTLKQWLEGGRVRVDGVVVRRGDAPVAPEARIALGAAPPPPFPAPLRLVHQDGDLLVIDKPPGLLTIATERERGRTAYRLLADWLAARAPRRGERPARLFIVHRLDRDTSGLLVFAKTFAVKRALQAQFEARTVERVYVAVVEGRVAAETGTLRDRLVEGRDLRVRPTGDPHAGKEAITRFRVLARGRDATVLELTLGTGRRRQIRAQLAAFGHPIVGDADAGSRRDPLHRLCLHATRLAFNARAGRVVCESPPPPAFWRL